MKHILTTLAVLALTSTTPALANDLVAPPLTAATPADQSQVSEPVSEIVLEFGQEVDLVDVKIITPDQNQIKLYKADGSDQDKKGVWFALTVPEPVTMPGTYLIDYAVSFTASDGSASATSAYSAFIITDPKAPKE